MGDHNLLTRAPPCFERHVKPLVPAAPTKVSRRVDLRQAAGRKKKLPNLNHNMMKNKPHLVWGKGRMKIARYNIHSDFK
jgi:hypothetical protein